jgi:hypothetical protein
MKMNKELIILDKSPSEMLCESDLEVIMRGNGQQSITYDKKEITWHHIALVNNIITKADMLNWLLSRQPKADWVKKHPYANNALYIPIAKIEQLIKQIFKFYKIEVLRENCWLNGFVVTVRLHYLSPADGSWHFHDGIGACELQTRKDAQASDLNSIVSGAWQKGVGVAKSEAVKNAAKSFGDYFGANLNRKEVDNFMVNPNQFGNNADKINNKNGKI